MTNFISPKSTRLLGFIIILTGLSLKFIFEKVFVPDGALDQGIVNNAITAVQALIVVWGGWVVYKRPAVKKDIFNNLALLGIGFVFAFLILEIFLRVYNPFHLRVKGNQITLPANATYKFADHKLLKVDDTIIHTKNSLGFRGENPPKEFDQYLTIVAVGGSTAECFFLSDGRTWVDQIERWLKGSFRNVWINNAGMDGLSTRGCILIMEDYIIKLKPKIVLFYVGMNDLTIATQQGFDDALKMNSISNKSETLSTFYYIYKQFKKQDTEAMHKSVDFKNEPTLEIAPEDYNASLQSHRDNLPGFEERLNKLIQLCRQNDIIPVFITHTSLFGPIIDAETNVDLAKVKTNDNQNGRLLWDTLELYNTAVRMLGQKENILVIDLAKTMPKNTKYYYDQYHFSNAGAELAGSLIFTELKPFIEKNFKDFIKN